MGTRNRSVSYQQPLPFSPGEASGVRHMAADSRGATISGMALYSTLQPNRSNAFSGRLRRNSEDESYSGARSYDNAKEDATAHRKNRISAAKQSGLHKIFEETAQTYPNSVAVEAGTVLDSGETVWRKITYKELDERAETVAPEHQKGWRASGIYHCHFFFQGLPIFMLQCLACSKHIAPTFQSMSRFRAAECFSRCRILARPWW